MEPGIRDGSMMWDIRQAREADAAQLSEVAQRIFRDTFEQYNTPEDMEMYCSEAFAPETLAAAIAEPRTMILVAGDENRLIAYAHLHRGDPHPNVTGNSPIELKRFYVLAAWHGTGLARELMREVMERSAALGAETLWLGVWERNHRAIRFYRKLGFDEVGDVRFMLGTDPQRDLVMTRQISDIW